MKALALNEDKGLWFIPTNLNEAMKLADLLSKSELVPKNYRGKPADILIAMMRGHQLGLNPPAALESIATINGTTSIFGDGFLAVLQSHPEYEYIDEKVVNDVGICKLKRKGKPEVIREYSIEDAKRAGLLGKDNWQKNPKRMLQMRARSWAGRDLFADALKGIKIAEEVQDYEIKNITPSANQTQEENLAKLTNILKEDEKVEISRDYDDVVVQESYEQEVHPEETISVDYFQESPEREILLNELAELTTDLNFNPLWLEKILERANVSIPDNLSEEQLQKAIDWIKTKIK